MTGNAAPRPIAVGFVVATAVRKAVTADAELLTRTAGAAIAALAITRPPDPDACAWAAEVRTAARAMAGCWLRAVAVADGTAIAARATTVTGVAVPRAVAPGETVRTAALPTTVTGMAAPRAVALAAGAAMAARATATAFVEAVATAAAVLTAPREVVAPAKAVASTLGELVRTAACAVAGCAAAEFARGAGAATCVRLVVVAVACADARGAPSETAQVKEAAPPAPAALGDPPTGSVPIADEPGIG